MISAGLVNLYMNAWIFFKSATRTSMFVSGFHLRVQEEALRSFSFLDTSSVNPNIFRFLRKSAKSAQGLFEKAAACFFEMSRPCQFWKSRLVLELISKFNLSSTSYYDRCSYSEEELPPVKHTFRVQGSVPLQPKLRCICERHRPLFQQNLEEMEVYPVRMTKEVASDVCRHFRDVFS